MSDNAIDFDELFDANKPKKKESPMDVKATQKKADDVFDEQEEKETVEETEASEVKEDTQVEEQEDSKPDENSVEFWKKKAEAAEKQKRDQQSYNDQRYNTLEKSFNEFKQSIQTQQQQPPKQEIPEMSKEDLQDLIYEDPEKAMIYVAQKNGLINSQPQQPVNMQLAVQEQVVRALNPDFDDVIEKFQEAVNLNPMILQEVKNAPNPVQAAYDKGKQILQAQDKPVDMETLKAEIRAELEEELNIKNSSRQSLRKVPGSPGVSGKKSVKRETVIDDFFS